MSKNVYHKYNRKRLDIFLVEVEYIYSTAHSSIYSKDNVFHLNWKHQTYDKRSVRELRDDVKESYKLTEEHLGKQELKVFAYPYGAYTKETVRTLQNNGIDFQIYDIGINNFKTLDRDFIKRINIPCEMTGQEIIEEIL